MMVRLSLLLYISPKLEMIDKKEKILSNPKGKYLKNSYQPNPSSFFLFHLIPSSLIPLN